jgi:anti-sigma-K factor RskA
MNIQEYISSGIIELYVMGVCSREEKLELEALRIQHPELNKAIIDFEIELEAKMLKNSTIPTSATDEKILKKLEELQTPVIEIDNKVNVKKITWLKPFAAAAILLLVAGSYFIFSLINKNKKLEQEIASSKTAPVSLPESDYKIMLDPKITPVAMYGVGTHAICRCTMFWDKKTGKMYIMIHHLPQSSSSRDYQLWGMVDNKPVSIGIVQDDIRGRFIELQNVPVGATSFTITLEKAGGVISPTVSETYLTGHI